MYTKKTLQRFQKPKFAKAMKNADAVGKVGNMKCGDAMKIYLKVKKDRIKDISFQTYGCVAAIACTDALCELAKGKTIDNAKKLQYKQIISKLGDLPPIKYHCSVLGIEALQEAIKNYKKKNKS